MVEGTRHSSAKTYVVCNGKFLLHIHKKLNKWLPVGGHIDREELPHDASVREVKEKTGLDVNFFLAKELLKTSSASEIIPPYKMGLYNLNPFHQNIDMVFPAKAERLEFVIPEGESDKMKWFSGEDIKNFDSLPEDVRVLALEDSEVAGK